MEDRNAFGLADRVCAVTGGGSGIGRGVAIALAKEGARVAILDRNEAGAQETLGLVRQAGAQGLAVACDTSDPESVEGARAAVAGELGDADVLVNNAGIVRSAQLADLPLEEWNRVLSVNLTGYFICSQAFGPAMRERGSGALVHVSSITAEQATPNIGAYGVSKAGVTMMSRLLAAEWGPAGVRSNAVHPGFVQTPMTQASYDVPAIARGRAQSVPLGRVALPDDIAQAVLFLASPRAGYVNGAQLLVDGGLKQNFMTLIPRFD